MDMLKDLYGKYAVELDADLAQNTEYKELLERIYEIIELNRSNSRIKEFDVLLGKIGGVIAEVSCISGIKFGARLVRTQSRSSAIALILSSVAFGKPMRFMRLFSRKYTLSSTIAKE